MRETDEKASLGIEANAPHIQFPSKMEHPENAASPTEVSFGSSVGVKLLSFLQLRNACFPIVVKSADTSMEAIEEPEKALRTMVLAAGA